MVGILAAQKVGIIDSILVGGVAAVGKNVSALKDLRSATEDIADDDDGCGSV